jgi:hypothetical protein
MLLASQGRVLDVKVSAGLGSEKMISRREDCIQRGLQEFLGL